VSESALTLRAATLEDSRLVWEWRNEPATRLASFNTEPIPLERHLDWFPRQLTRPDSRMFIAETTSHEPVGVVRFDGLAGAPEVSIALAPGHRGKGHGRQVLAEACARIFRETGAPRIVALVRRDNPASASAFTRAGFAHDADLDVRGIPSSRFVLVRPA
jgi:UDP-2,4-diacetamido-2,4,6-trideoxy-beta-L-altropyranose hydrolase